MVFQGWALLRSGNLQSKATCLRTKFRNTSAYTCVDMMRDVFLLLTDSLTKAGSRLRTVNTSNGLNERRDPIVRSRLTR